MTELPRYTIAQSAFQGSETIVYRGRRDMDGAPVAVKVTRDEYPTARQLGRLRREFGILQEIKRVPGVVRAYALEKYGRGIALVMEDLGASSLRDVIGRRKLDLTTALRLAISLTETLDSIHRLGIIHKDIKPHNIMVADVTDAPSFIDFGIAVRLSQETPQAGSATTLEGTLAYMSPEQTGRMNRVVDLRTDLYSLGATLYEVLTSELPFSAQDPTEIIHCHIARIPTPPHERVREIPRALSDVVMKLLAKTPEDRYQSARGLKADLEQCLRQWTTEGCIAPIALGSHDHPDELRIPQKLYGRAGEVTALLSAFEEARRGAPSLLVIAGSSGVGKSALVNEIHKPIARQGGYFVRGKFDLLGRDVPLAALGQVFRGLLQQILTESSSALEGWRRRLLDAIGGNGRVLCEIAPQLEIIVGPQPEVPALGPAESQNRFDLLVRRFLGAFARPEHPLCVFLDDLQWADPVSLRLLRVLLSDPECKHLLILGAYRDNEVDAAHPLAATLDALRKTDAALTELTLTPLDPGTVHELVADTLRAAPGEVAEIAEALFDKTQGNPFFLGQLLRTLEQEGIVRFEPTTAAFTWDVERARAAVATDNVIELMASKLKRLPPDTQQVLKRAACIGHTFELGMLATIAARPPAEVAATLWRALKEGLVVPEGGDYRLLDGGVGIPERAEELSVSYRFLHDRVQQAAYALIEEEQRAALHLSIGRLLLARSGGAPRDDELLEVVRQMNLGARGISDDTELRSVGQLNLRAGRRAKSTTAYQAAAGFFAAGITLLGEGGFTRDYALAAALHLEGAEYAYLSGAVERADALFDALLPRVKTDLERARIHHMRVILYTTRGKYAEAMAEGRAALALLGVVLPEGEAVRPAAAAELREVAENLGGRRPEDLLDAKQMNDPALRLVLELLGDLTLPAHLVDLSLRGVLVLKQVNLSLKHGHTDLSAFAYATYGVLLSGTMGKPVEGYAFGRLALALSEKFPSPVLAGRVACTFAVGMFRIEPLRAVIPYFERVRDATLAVGDFVFLGSACYHLFLIKLGAGVQLAEFREEVDKNLALVRRIQSAVPLGVLTLAKQVIANLEGRTLGRDTLSDGSFDEEAFFRSHCAIGQGPVGYFYWAFKLLIHSLHGDHARAALAAEAAEQRSLPVFTTHFTAQVPFRACLALAALPAAEAPEQASARRAAMARHRALSAELAEHCPANFQHQLLLLDAEAARLDGRHDEALCLYDQAIAAAAMHDFPQDEALANELAAKLYLALGRPKAARGYMLDAYRGYLHWGATAKAEDLARDHGALLALAALSEQSSNSHSSMSLTTTGTTIFSQTTVASVRDAALVVRATQAITGELLLPKVIERLSKIVLENAGAQQGALLLSREGQLFVEATFGVDPSTLAVGPSTPLEAHRDIAQSVALFVARTRAPLVIDDARLDPRFAADPHIEGDRVRSILCLPLVHQQRLGGLLYLEHRDAAAAFNTARVELLALFSSQAAIALENARLMADIRAANEQVQTANAQLEADVADRTLALRQSNRELFEANERLQVELGQRAQAERERAALQEQMIQAQRERLLETSTPLIPITERVVVMPLIGTMDQERASQVLEAALRGAQHHRARVVILDVTGLRHIDTQVVNTLLSTASALRLLGAQAVLTGIQPAMAQTMVLLGVSLDAIVTRGTLESGIAYALEVSSDRRTAVAQRKVAS